MVNDNRAHNRLILGTVQIGLDYGIANETGKPDLKCAEDIIRTAWANGIQEFDTAQNYGDGEKILGQIITTLKINDDIRVISKFNPDIEISDIESLKKSIINSLDNLKISKLHCIMFHRESALDQLTSKLSDMLKSFIYEGLIDHIGISVSSPAMAIKALNNKLISIVQIPSNILDRRFEKAGVFDLADACSKTIYVRSIFLQGLLMMNNLEIPVNMRFAQKVVSDFEKYIEEKNIDREAVLMGYPREAYQNAKIIFGAETVVQVKSNIQTWNTNIDKQIVKDIPSIFDYTDEKLLNPALWPK